jgi:dimethylargininase
VSGRAIVRPPGQSFVRAISTSGAAIDVRLAQAQHAEYRQALAAAGLEVEALPPDERYPDSCFMQDPAVVIDGVAVVGRMGVESRQGEEEQVAALLAALYPVARITAPGTLEGGDVLIMHDRVVIGRSGRTNRAGIEQLSDALADAQIKAGRPVLPVYAAPVGEYLHLLSAVTCIGWDVVLAVEDFPLLNMIGEPTVLSVPVEEAYACNALAVGSNIILPAGYPRTAAMLEAEGFEVLEVPTSEFEKADGGVTCLALLCP